MLRVFQDLRWREANGGNSESKRPEAKKKPSFMISPKKNNHYTKYYEDFWPSKVRHQV